MPVFCRRGILLLAAAGLAPTAGCCGLAAYFCGPDRSTWVAQDFQEPDRALATFLEAIRRDRPDVVYRSLSESAKERYGLTSVVDATVAWKHLKDQVGGLHVLGRAKIPPPLAAGNGRAVYRLSIAGHEFEVALVEQAFWDVWFTGEDERDLERAGRFVDSRQFRRMLVLDNDPEPHLQVKIEDLLLPELEPRQVREVRAGYMWKVEEIRGLEEPCGPDEP